jgi:hypothetical protein
MQIEFQSSHRETINRKNLNTSRNRDPYLFSTFYLPADRVWMVNVEFLLDLCMFLYLFSPKCNLSIVLIGYVELIRSVNKRYLCENPRKLLVSVQKSNIYFCIASSQCFRNEILRKTEIVNVNDFLIYCYS